MHVGRFFTVVSAMAGASLIVFADCDRSLQARQPRRPSAEKKFESFGDFKFELPTGWSKVQPDRGKTVAMILLNGKTWDKADGMIKIDVGKPAVPTAEAMARSLAGADGQVLRKPVSLDGHDGVRVKTASEDMSRPHHAVVCYKDGKVYLLMAAAVNGKQIDDAFNHVLKTWHWVAKP
jgi:hypothetical protein